MTNKIVIEGSTRARYYARKWLEIYDGGSDTWLYAARSGLTYVFIEIMDYPAAAGRDAEFQWCADVSSVDLESSDPEMIASALGSCGQEDDPPDMSTESGRLALAEMLHSHGAKSPLWDDLAGKPREHAGEHSKDFKAIRAAARRVAEDMLDDAKRDNALDTRIVNKIGQTARQYASGTAGLWDHLRTIRDAGENATPEQKLVLRMYSKCEQTLGAGPIPEDLRE